MEGQIVVDEGIVGRRDGGRVFVAGVVHAMTVAHSRSVGYKRKRSQNSEEPLTLPSPPSTGAMGKKRSGHANRGSYETGFGAADRPDSQRGLHSDRGVWRPSH